MDEIFSNLLVLIPLSILIAMRIMQSRAQQRERYSVKQKPQPRPPMFPMSEETPLETRGVNFRSGIEPAFPLPYSEVEPEEPLPYSTPEVVKPIKIGAMDAQVLQPKSSPELLTDRIAKLSPWKRGVVLREILGPPKGD